MLYSGEGLRVPGFSEIEAFSTRIRPSWPGFSGGPRTAPAEGFYPPRLAKFYGDGSLGIGEGGTAPPPEATGKKFETGGFSSSDQEQPLVAPQLMQT